MPKRARNFAFVVFVLTAPTVPVFADSCFVLLYQKTGASAGDSLGWSVDGIGDLDGDDKSEFIIGAPGSPGGPSRTGSVFVYSGATGALLYQKDGDVSSQQRLGTSVAGTKDMNPNGDGKPDFIVGAPVGIVPPNFPGQALVYSGATGALLYQVSAGGSGSEFGWAVDGVGNVKPFGERGFIVGAPRTGLGVLARSGSVFVYGFLFPSDSVPYLVYQKDGTGIDDRLGWAVAGAGDPDGDGWADFIVGTPQFSGAAGNPGLAFVYSGRFGNTLYVKTGQADHDLFGYSVGGTGDLNGDGRDDFIVGAPFADPGGVTNAGSAYVYSGTGPLLYQINGNDLGVLALGTSVAGVGDATGDGRPDFIVSALTTPYPGPPDSAAQALLFSGATGALLGRIYFPWNTPFIWTSVRGAGDVNLDGRADLIIGSPQSGQSPLNNGSAYVYSFAPTCAAAKGDMNADGNLTASDVVLELNCTFLGTGSCDLCFADVNCDGVLTASDVVSELNLVFLGTPPSGCP